MYKHLGHFSKQENLSRGHNVSEKPKLGSGERFEQLSNKLESRGAKSPDALAAFIGRKKYGKAKFQKLAAKGKK